MLELATLLNLDKSSVTGLVDRAERCGLVRRTSTADDRRAVHVSVTERGREVTQKFVKQLERELNVLVEGLSENDRKRLSALASRIVFNDAERLMPGVSLVPRTR